MIDRKKLKQQYKESHRPMGVYAIRNRDNGLIFVGSSVNLPAIFNRWRMQLNTNSQVKYPALQDDWRRLGSEAFEFEVLEELEPDETPGWTPQDDLQVLEELWLEKLEPFGERGYNRRSRGI